MAKPFVGVASREGTLEWIVQIWLNLISRNLEENRYVLIWTTPRYYGHILSNQPLSHFIILKTPLMRPPRYYARILWPNGGRINGVPL